jgi:aryl-alcohol dehydrogenase-like predicted oxidoreductase
MSFGKPGHERPWVVGEGEAKAIVRRALDGGINFFDTANTYSGGTSEEIIGELLLSMVPREEVVIATKVHGAMRRDVNGRGLSRKAILHEIDQSLKRLGTDYVDLYQIHRFSYETPVEETLEALNDVVRAGKALYVGASSMWAHQFMKMLMIQRQNGWAQFVSMQNHLNLIYREEEREMLPLCRAEGIGVLTWSPLARGRLTRPAGSATARAQTDKATDKFYAGDYPEQDLIIDAVARLAAARGVSPARIALAWVLAQQGVTAPIVGATRLGHLEDALAALEVTLTADEIATLEAPYKARPVAGHR